MKGRLAKNGRLRRIVSVVFLPVLWLNGMTVCATPLLREEIVLYLGSRESWTREEVAALIEKLAEIADEEIEMTAFEAVRAAVAEVGGELAAEVSLREDWQNEEGRLELLNEAIKKEAAAEKKKADGWRTAFFVETAVLAGVIAGFAVFAGVR